MTEPAALAVLELSGNEGYLHWQLPCRRDDDIAELVEALLAGGGRLSREHGQVLSAYAERMATLAVRRGSAEAATRGVLGAAVALAAPGDFRDALPALALLYRAAELIGVDPESLFLGAAEKAGPAGGPIVRFTRRQAEDRSIAAMGYSERHDDEGFRFERDW